MPPKKKSVGTSKAAAGKKTAAAKKTATKTANKVAGEKVVAGFCLFLFSCHLGNC